MIKPTIFPTELSGETSAISLTRAFSDETTFEEMLYEGSAMIHLTAELACDIKITKKLTPWPHGTMTSNIGTTSNSVDFSTFVKQTPYLTTTRNGTYSFMSRTRSLTSRKRSVSSETQNLELVTEIVSWKEEKEESVGRILGVIANFPKLSGKEIHYIAHAKVKDNLGGRCQFVFDKWIVTLDSFPSKMRETWFQDENESSVTHAFHLQRQDSSLFTRKQAISALRFVNLFLSFVSGQQTEVLLAEGWRHLAQPIWRLWGQSSPSLKRSGESWASRKGGDVTLSCAQGLYLLYSNEDSREWIQNAIELYSKACASLSSPDVCVIIAQTGLELLAWVYIVEENHLISEPAFDKLPAHDKIRLLANSVKVNVPTTKALSDVVNKFSAMDAFEVFTEFRNHLVHPTKRSRSSLEKLNDTDRKAIRNLGVYVFECCLLSLCGYKAHFFNRITNKGHFDTEEIVPWAHGL